MTGFDSYSVPSSFVFPSIVLCNLGLKGGPNLLDQRNFSKDTFCNVVVKSEMKGSVLHSYDLVLVLWCIVTLDCECHQCFLIFSPLDDAQWLEDAGVSICLPWAD